MGEGISIGVASDTKQFTSGIKSGVLEPLEDVAESLEDVAKAGEKGGDKLVDALKDSQRETEKNEKAYRDMASTIQRTTKATSSGFEISTREQTHLRKEAIKEIGNEAKQNASETFSSFDGSAQSFVDGIQGTLGGLVSSLGPIGLAAGAAGALGIGLINGALQNGDTKTQEFKAEVAELSKAIIDAGNEGGPSIDALVSKIEDLATGTDDAGKGFRKALKDIKAIGGSSKDVAKALAGDPAALAAATKQVHKYTDELRKNQEQITDVSQQAAVFSSKGLKAALELEKQLDTQTEKQKEAAKGSRAYAESGAADAAAHAAAVGAAVESIQSSLHDAGAAWEDYNADGTTTLDEYNAHIEATIAATGKYVENVKTVSKTVTGDALRYIESLGQDAAPILQAFVDAPLDQQSRTASNWDKLGKSSGATYSKSLTDSLPKEVAGPKVKVSADTADADATLKRLAQQHVKVTVEGVTRSGQRVF